LPGFLRGFGAAAELDDAKDEPDTVVAADDFLPLTSLTSCSESEDEDEEEDDEGVGWEAMAAKRCVNVIGVVCVMSRRQHLPRPPISHDAN
jgi:hypothetical protein